MVALEVRCSMGARQQLNRLHFSGDIALAALAGFVVQSWAAFLLALVVLVGLDLHAGFIRPARGQRGPGPREVRRRIHHREGEEA